MKLNVYDRVLLLPLLPDTGDIATLRSLHEAKMVIGLSADEVTEFDFKIKGDTATWNIKGNEEKEIAIDKVITRIVKDKLVELDEKKELRSAQISLYEKFVE